MVLGLLAKLLFVSLFAAEGTGPMPQCALLHSTVPHSTPSPVICLFNAPCPTNRRMCKQATPSASFRWTTLMLRR